MRIQDTMNLACYSRTHAYYLQGSQHLPFAMCDPDVFTVKWLPKYSYLLAVQRELCCYVASTDEACDILLQIQDDIREKWDQVIFDHYWLIVSYDTPRLMGTSAAIRLIGRAMRNGSRQRGWPVNLSRVLLEMRTRARDLGIKLPPAHDVKAWWGV